MFDKLLSLMTLTDEHREELKSKRGFTDEAIDKFGFRSAVKPDDAESVKAEMLKHYEEQELKDAKILLSADDINPKSDAKVGDLTFTVVGERILVPFFDAEGRCTYVRQHKFGLSGTTPHVYDATRAGEDSLILTEGEFKAGALWQLGYSACASPGISLFGGKNFGILEDWILSKDVDEVHIMFDGEVKDDPIKYPKQYKPDKRVRHDTDWWAYKLARMLDQSGIKTKVVSWPESWLIDGKIDPDAAIAAGRTRDEFDALLENAYTHKEFRKSWSGEKKQVLEQKAKKEAFKSDIVQRNGQYYKKVKKGDEEYEVQFTNFTMEIVAKHTVRNEESGETEILREALIHSQDGEYTEKINILPSHMTSPAEFKKAVMSVGDFIYTGDGNDLTNLINRLFAEQEVKDCHRPIQVGKIDDRLYSGFFMGNVAFTEQGVVNSDEEGGFWVKDVYVKPDSYIVDGATSIHLNTEQFDWRQGIDKLCEAYGSHAPRVLVMWQIASLFRDVFFKIRGGRGFFPLMYVGGGYKSGKTTLTGQVQNFLGMGDIFQMDMSSSTKAGLDRSVRYYSHLPLWIDEVRADTIREDTQGMFRNMYNGSAGLKAMRTGTSQVRTTDVNCTLLLSGQETPPDAALNERMIKINISAGTRPKNTDAFKWVSKHLNKLSYMAYEMLGRYDEVTEYIKKHYVDNIEDMNDRLANTRVAGNYAVILTLAEMLGMDKIDGFEDYIFELASESCTESEERNESNVIFMEMLDIMQEESIHAAKYFHTRRDDNDIDVAWTKMYSKYKEVKSKRRESVMDNKALLNQLKDAGVATVKCNSKVDGHMTRCWRLRSEKLPDVLVKYINDNYGRKDGF